MQNKLEYIAFSFVAFLVRILGLNLSRKLSIIMALLFYYLIPIRKKTVIGNITLAFPEYSKRKVKKISFKCYRSFAITLVEILYMPNMTKEEIINSVTCTNPDSILKEYKKNNGVILLSAHFGNWEYNAASVAVQINLPLLIVTKPQRNPYVTDWLEKARTKWENEVVSLGLSIRQIYKELKEKNIVAMVADQRGPADGIRVNFFGRKVSVYPGPALLSLRTGAPILYGIAIRQPDYSYKMTLVEINKENLPDNEEEKIIEISQRHTSYLEGVMKQYPEQWFWMHKRWKY
jgi:Kdo2-lipid IVA lauroyltransferase/acyltransferase